MYKYKVFKDLANHDGLNYSIDVYNDTVYLGTLEVKPNGGVVIKAIDTPTSKKIIRDSPKFTYKTQEQAAKMLHKMWKIYRSGKMF